ncbi:MAG: hydantoinase/oxoprolinase family protein, partial [Solirubrobacterales bacterium]
MESSAGRRGPRSFKVTCDVGGTFTDVVATDSEGGTAIGKALTTPHSLLEGLTAAIAAAAEGLELSAGELLAATDLFVYATTQATNAVLVGATARTALLCTEGFPDVLVRREGGSLRPYDFTGPPPEPYVPRRLTFEVPERIGADGSVVRALDEALTAGLVNRLADRGVEAVAVCLLWSVVNPAHELRLGEILAAELPGVPFTLSHQLNPVVREYRRSSCTAIDASLKPIMQEHLREVAEGLRGLGFGGELLAANSLGGVIPMDDLAERPVYAVRSGPALAPVAGRAYAREELEQPDVIVCDTGGTSFDVSLIRAGEVVTTRETWLGEPFVGHLTGLSSVDARSVGAGGGSIAWIDSGGLLRVGPQSAGAEPGPACYGNGGEQATVTDSAVVLGYLDPD